MAEESLRDTRTGANVHHSMIALLRQSVYGWLAGYEDLNDDDRASSETLRSSMVASARRSPRANRKAAFKRTQEGAPVHSSQTLLADLATIVKNRIQPKLPGAGTCDKLTEPTLLQSRALGLLGLRV